MRPVLSASRALLGELKLAPHDWPAVLPAVSSALNSASLDRLGSRDDGITRTPLEVMTGIQPRRPILQIIPSGLNITQAKTISHARTAQIISINQLQEALDNLHRNVSTSSQARRERAVEAHNKATNIVAPNFSVGDFVLVRRASDKGHKLKFRWFGPRRITSVHGPLVYGVTPLRGGNAERVHCARLLLYPDSLLGTTVPDEVLDLADRTESRYETTDRITDIGEKHDGIFLRIQWDGLPYEHDWTWHPLH